jgi:hypothetical protein
MNNRCGAKGRRRRSVQPLPSYTRREPLAGGRWGYYFEPPTWARKPRSGDDRGPCPVGREVLGTDYAEAVKRAEKVLLPLFDSWRTRGVVDLVPAKGAQRGTLDWLFGVYRADDKFKVLGRKVRELHEAGFALVGDHVLKDGRRLGDVRLASIDAAKVDKLYKKLLPLRDDAGNPLPLFPPGSLPDRDGEPLYAERRTTVNHAMKSCRRAWNVAVRLHPKDAPAANPFAKMGLVSRTKPVEAATYADLLAAVAQADAMGFPSLGTALMVTWEWLQREEHIFTAFKFEHYRPKKHPNEVLIVHPKNGEEVWIPLFDKGTPIFPELMARMDAARRIRIGAGLFFMRDWVDDKAGVPLPWATKSGNLRHASRKVADVLKRTGLDPSITFTSFRHGGMTECGDGDLTDAQIRALSRHKSAKVLRRYVKRTEKQIIDGTHKRRALRPTQTAEAIDQLDLFAGITKGGR